MTEKFKIIYAPSGKRIIPYPPVGVSILAESVYQELGWRPEVFDLEMMLNHIHYEEKTHCLLYSETLRPDQVMHHKLTDKIREYGEMMAELIRLNSASAIGISVMGFEQVASALLLSRLAWERGIRVILGGQFWTHQNAVETLTMFSDKPLTITVGDGWRAVVEFLVDPDSVPANSYAIRDGKVVEGAKSLTSIPPEPDYSWVSWELYEKHGSRVYGIDSHIRRAHLYVWDKKCNFRCAFCRVSSGSNAIINSPDDIVGMLGTLIQQGVRHFNFMTNELNPSRKYLLNLLDLMEAKVNAPINWFTYTRADKLEKDDFRRIRRVGGRLLRYGIESGSQRLLDWMRKDYDVTTMAETLRYASESDIWNHINLLVGFPGENEEDIERTISFLRENASSIHSVRINPFYLPPDTPIARHPEQFGIKLKRFHRGWWEFEYLDGTQVDPDVIAARIHRLTGVCEELGIGFAGTDPFFLLDMISRFDSREEAKAYLRQAYGFFWEPAPTDYYKSKLGNYTIDPKWENTIFKRGSNYSLQLCTD